MKAQCLLVAASFILGAAEREKKLTFEQLPAAVQAAAREQAKNATVLGYSSEKEKGKTVYEVETKVNGKSRDFLLDQTGAVLETEEQIDMDSVPAGAKEAILKKAKGGAIKLVEKVTELSVVSYEAHIKTKTGRTLEVHVNADGTPHAE